MAFKIIIFIFLSSVFTACSDMEPTRRDRRGPERNRYPGDIASSSACLEFQEEDEDEEGSRGVESLETVSFANWLSNCSAGDSTPDNAIDIIVTAVGIQNKYMPKKLRNCLRCKLADAHSRICSARDELERQRQDANSESDRIRVENSIARLDEIQYKFNDTLYRQANKYNTRANNFADKDSKTLGGRFWNWVGQHEAEAFRDILNTESYNECNNFRYDDSDDFRYEDEYRNDPYGRRRSY